MRWITAIVGWVLGLLVVAVAFAGNFQRGVEAYQQKDYETAYREFLSLAQQGHIDALNNLGVLHNTGRGVAQDYAAAAAWYRKAAERGHASAQTNLGILYANGQGVPQDDMLAYAWTNLATQQGTERARRYRDQAAAKLSAEQLAQAQQLNLLQSLLTPETAEPGLSAPTVIAAIEPSPRATVKTATTVVNGVYGPVAAGETLWSIATKIKPAEISTQQMILAIQRLNPEAFATNKVDSLKAAVSLRVPSAAEASQISVEQARAEVQRQLGN